MVDGVVLKEMSYIMNETVFEEMNKSTAWTHCNSLCSHTATSLGGGGKELQSGRVLILQLLPSFSLMSLPIIILYVAVTNSRA